MVDTVTDFISLIKDIRGNQFDNEGLPLNGKWKDIKDWHTSVGLTADQVVIDAAEVASNKDATAANLLSAVDIEANTLASANASAVSASESDTSALASAASAVLTAADAVATNAVAASITVDQLAIAAAVVAAETSAISSGNFSATAGASAAAASLSEGTAAVSAANALQSENNVGISEGNTLAYRDATATLQEVATSSASTAVASAAEAASSESISVQGRNASRLWAVEVEDTLVDDGTNIAAYSSYHWAQKAAAIVGGVTGFTDFTDTPASYAGSAGFLLSVNPSTDGIEFVQGTGADVQLGNVDNTADLLKPLSTATVNALALKGTAVSVSDLDIRVTATEADTLGITNEIAAGSNPARVQISKVVYSTASQTLGAVEPAALTRHDLTAAMIAAETIGAY